MAKVKADTKTNPRLISVSLIQMCDSREIRLKKSMKKPPFELLKQAHLADPNHCHAFFIETKVELPPNRLLQIIENFVHPHSLWPLTFEYRGKSNSGKTHRYMLSAKDCIPAITAICANKMLIPNPDCNTAPIVFPQIILKYNAVTNQNIDVIGSLKNATSKIYTYGDRIMNLDNFIENEVVSNHLPLSDPSILYQALGIVAGYNPIVIKLRNNDIESLSSQENFWKCSYLQILDLRNNKISDISAFEGLKGLKLIEIYLDGNPICDKMDAYTYVSELKNIFPCLMKIDGVLIKQYGLPAFNKNFLCDLDGFNVVNKFVETYFFRYDKDRKALIDLYHSDALCSMTFAYKIGQTTSHDARLRPYQVNARNLLSMADVARSHQFLVKGNQNIVSKLIELPQLEHDTFSFTVDLVYHSEKVSIINISGVFREFPESILSNERHLGFMRTFHLRNHSGDYFITNDMLHVYNALSTQVSGAFKITCSRISTKLPIAQTAKEKQKAVEAVRTVTGLTNGWSKRLLEEYGYNLMDSMKYFMDMYKIDKIPLDAFEEKI